MPAVLISRFCWLFLGLVSLFAASTATAWDIDRGTAWSQANFTRLDVQFPGSGFHARWDYFRCACGDVLIRSEEILNAEVTTDVVNGTIAIQNSSHHLTIYGEERIPNDIRC